MSNIFSFLEIIHFVLATQLTGTSASTPDVGEVTLKEVLRATWNVRARWFDLGIELDFSYNTLEVS